MRVIYLCFLLCSSLSLFAQKSPIKFGDIPMEDMKMTIYDKDSSASAVVLTDFGKAYINDQGDNYVLTFERHIRIKILKNDGLEWANSTIRLLRSGSTEEKVASLSASTYNLENGKIVETKMSKDGIFKEKFSRNYNLQKFTLPNVKVGSIIEYSYKIISGFFTVFPNWQFQRTIPTRWSEYIAIIPTGLFYEKYMQGYVPLTINETKTQNYLNIESSINRWAVENVPAFKEEPFMTSDEDYISKINFALSHIQHTGYVQEIMGSWEKLNDNFLEYESFGKSLTSFGFLKDEVAKITTGMADPIPKITALSNYVKQNFEWDGTDDYLADPLKKVFEKKKGTSGDLNILLGSMLNKAGFDVDLVLLSTRDHGFIRQSYPMERQFNYTVCAVKVEDKTLLLDATEKYLPYDVLPSKCLNGQGLRISKSNFGWVNLTSRVKDKRSISGDFVLDDAGMLQGKISYTSDGYDAQMVRSNYFSKGEENYAKDFLSNKQWKVTKSEFKDMKEIDKSAKASYEINIDEHATSAGNVLYINPFVASRIEENPFKS
ncbi:MAG TPA: DUF3857 domain-containing protein, partial [Cyclobacteriaceae bacterium]|nr:DUF3857 domain-containing protein [Cyclobacteriaceae bacterium]